MESHLSCLIELNKGNMDQAYLEYAKEGVAMKAVNVVKEVGEDWCLKPFEQVCYNLKDLAQLADDALRKAGKKADRMENCGSLLQTGFSRLFSAQGANAVSRRATLSLVCLLMKVYFRLNAIARCTQITKTVDRAYRDLDEFPAPYRVTYYYYLGRIAVFGENFVDANNHLSYAFQHCHVSCTTHKRKILRYLIPVKLLLGEVPTQELLTRFGLMEYQDITQALVHGDVGLMEKTLLDNQYRYIKVGTYLLFEKLVDAAYRRLFKKCQLVQARLNPGKANQVPISLMQAALLQQGLDKSIEELECILANLIAKGYIKGYISHKSKVVVTSKMDAFPAPSLKWLQDPV